MAELYFPPSPSIGDTETEDNGRTYIYQAPGVWTIQFSGGNAGGDWVPITGGTFEGTVGWDDTNNYTNVNIKTDGDVTIGSNNTDIVGKLTFNAGTGVTTTDSFLVGLNQDNQVFSVQYDGGMYIGAQPAGSSAVASIVLDTTASNIDVHGSFSRTGTATNGLYAFSTFNPTDSNDANFVVGVDGSINVAANGTDARATPSIKVGSDGQLSLGVQGKGIQFPDGTIQTSAASGNLTEIPNLQQVTDKGATTTNDVTVAGLDCGTSNFTGNMTVTGDVEVTGAGNIFKGDGSGLTNLPIGAIFSFLGPVNVTQTAPVTSSFTGGETYLNNTAGNADASWNGLGQAFIALNQYVIWSANAPGGAKWVTGAIIDPTGYVTTGTVQDITATKTFTVDQKFSKNVTIDQNCTVAAGYFYNGDGSKLTGITSSQINGGDGLKSLTAGSYMLSSTGNPYDGEADTTFNVEATSDNTPSKIIARDGSGNFAAASATFNAPITVTTQQTLYSDTTQDTDSRKLLMTAATAGSEITMYGGTTTPSITLTASTGDIVSTGIIHADKEIISDHFLASDDTKVKIGVNQNNVKYALLVDDTDDETEHAYITIAGFASFAGTVETRATVDGDSALTTTTKGYVDGLLSGGAFWQDQDGNLSPKNALLSVAVGDSASPGVLLTANGAGTFTGALASDSLAVTAGATIGTTLGVSGAATLDSLGVTNNATVGGTLGVTGATTLAGLTAGASTLDAATITNNATVGGTLGVTGTSSLTNTGITGDLTVSQTLEVTGASTLTGDADIETIVPTSGELDVTGDLDVSGSVKAASLTDGTTTKSMTDVLAAQSDITFQDVTDNGSTTTDTISAAGYSFTQLATLP